MSALSVGLFLCLMITICMQYICYLMHKQDVRIKKRNEELNQIEENNKLFENKPVKGYLWIETEDKIK